jgi:hypothetical protein
MQSDRVDYRSKVVQELICIVHNGNCNQINGSVMRFECARIEVVSFGLAGGVMRFEGCFGLVGGWLVFVVGG